MVRIFGKQENALFMHLSPLFNPIVYVATSLDSSIELSHGSLTRVAEQSEASELLKRYGKSNQFR